MYNARNHIYGENFKLKRFTCAESMALGTHAKFQLEILTSMISVIHKFQENLLESLQNICEPHNCLLIRLFRRRSKKLPLCGEFTGDWWIPRTNGQ